MQVHVRFFGGKIFWLLIGSVFLTAFQAYTSQLFVSNKNDSGPGSLRQAILDNNTLGGSNLITFSNVVTGTIVMTNGEFLIKTNVAILGPGAAVLAINGNVAKRVFHITNAANAFISGLTITNSPAPYPGAVYNDHSTLTLSNCVITGNQAGGIYNDGSASFPGAATYIVSTTISSNVVNGGNGAGIQNYGYGGTAYVAIVSSTLSGNATPGLNTAGGGVVNLGNSGSAAVAVSNSTFSGNSSVEGGAIYSSAASGVGPVTIFCSTFSSNSASAAGGVIFNNGVGGTAIVTFGNSILKAGASGGNIAVNGGSIVSKGFNLSSDTAGGYFTNATDQTNKEPLLGPLADNGGPTFTHALLPGSPALDKGYSFGLATDQRGQPRPFDFNSLTNATGGDGSDIGAFEVGHPQLVIQKTGTNAVLSWLAYATNFSLQFSTNLALSNSWSTATGSAVLVGSQYQQTNGPLAGTRFFRLQQN
jgi:hypothetical protein